MAIKEQVKLIGAIHALEADNQRGGAGVVNLAERKRTDTFVLTPKGLGGRDNTGKCGQINLLTPATVVALRPASRRIQQSYFGKVGGQIGRAGRMQWHEPATAKTGQVACL